LVNTVESGHGSGRPGLRTAQRNASRERELEKPIALDAIKIVLVIERRIERPQTQAAMLWL
jgi:hypothetical protein